MRLGAASLIGLAAAVLAATALVAPGSALADELQCEPDSKVPACIERDIRDAALAAEIQRKIDRAKRQKQRMIERQYEYERRRSEYYKTRRKLR